VGGPPQVLAAQASGTRDPLYWLSRDTHRPHAPTWGFKSERLRHRLAGENVFDWLALRMVERLPEDQREAMWLKWQEAIRPKLVKP
jgi:hypothetical protein